MSTTKLERYQYIKSSIEAAISWFSSKNISERDVVVLRVGKFNRYRSEDFIDTSEEPTNEELIKLAARTIAAPVDFMKVTERVSSLSYNMYSYKAPYETINIPEHSNADDKWSYFIPENEVAPYVTTLLDDIDAMFNEAISRPDVVDPQTDIGTLATKVRTISPVVKSNNAALKLQYADGTIAYPAAQSYDDGGITKYRMYQDLDLEVVTALAYLAYKSNFFKYKDEDAHGDVVVINAKTVYDKEVYDGSTGLLKTEYGLLGELLDSVNTNITVLQGV